MPDHALKAAIRTNNARVNDSSNGIKSIPTKATTPKVDNSRSRLVREQKVGSRIYLQ